MLPPTLQPLQKATKAFWWAASILWPACLQHDVLLFMGDGMRLFACRVLDKDTVDGPTRFMLDPERPASPPYARIFEEVLRESGAPVEFGPEVILQVIHRGRALANKSDPLRPRRPRT